MSQIINGKKIAEEIKDKVAKEVFAMQGPMPNLAIVLVGERPDSKLYVSIKEREAKKVGIDTHLYACPEDISEEEIIEMIEHLNKDELIDSILVQLPLPEGFDTDKVIQAIDPAKDVDFFHPDNLEKTFSNCDTSEIASPVVKTVFRMLCSVDCNLEDKKVCVLCNSEVFGKSLVKSFQCAGADAEVMLSKDFDAELSAQADVLVVALGKPNFIKKEMVKEDAIVIDVGTTDVEGKVVGDVDFSDVEKKVAYISPVPGGVGPMTVAYLFENCLEMYKKRKK
jgi:methylenetetrahydrofolate dehydrogenase (NADP+)/methenyltetrahydrofolate cyclohydrolase